MADATRTRSLARTGAAALIIAAVQYVVLDRGDGVSVGQPEVQLHHEQHQRSRRAFVRRRGRRPGDLLAVAHGHEHQLHRARCPVRRGSDIALPPAALCTPWASPWSAWSTAPPRPASTKPLPTTPPQPTSPASRSRNSGGWEPTSATATHRQARLDEYSQGRRAGSVSGMTDLDL